MPTDPADKPKIREVDGQKIEQHSLPDRIAWEKHQAEKAAGGGFGAMRFGQVRLGGVNDSGAMPQ
jgi:hypothetical protein